jgi:hypothetical protein
MNNTLKSLYWMSAAMLVAVTGLSTATAQETNAPSLFDFDYYRIVGERNIFNQNRSPARPGRDTQRGNSTERSDTISYVGFMHYEKGLYAFFDGSSSEYRKDLSLGGTIAGFSVVEITAHSVTLERNGNQTELKIGSQMRRRGQGEWQVSDAAETSAAGSTGGGTEAASQPLEVGSGPGADILKNLMERRAKEGL